MRRLEGSARRYCEGNQTCQEKATWVGWETHRGQKFETAYCDRHKPKPVHKPNPTTDEWGNEREEK